MEIRTTSIAARLRLAEVLIVLGVLAQAFTLLWNNPISFLVFLGVAGLLIVIGTIVYLLSLV